MQIHGLLSRINSLTRWKYHGKRLQLDRDKTELELEAPMLKTQSIAEQKKCVAKDMVRENFDGCK
jgi:hypothetical protein